MTRFRIDLDGTWEFFVDPAQRLRPEDLDRAGPPRRIVVPGPWQAQFDDLRLYSGVAWYRRRFEIPSGAPHPGLATAEPVYLIHFGAVDYFATVWLNGELLGEHEGGYLPFELELGAALRPGVNELVVRVVDPATDADYEGMAFAEIPHGKQSWYGPIGGIWQSVYVEARHQLHISGLRITPHLDRAEAVAELTLNRPAPQRLPVALELTDPLGRVVRHARTLEAGASRLGAILPVPDPLPWDVDAPNLYRLEARLLSAPDEHGMPLDARASNFGMRSIATSPSGHLLLNGRILYLRGALDQDYYPKMIYTPFSDAELDDQFRKAKQMGLNCLRTHIKITDPRYYDAADRAGILIWTELPNWQDLTEAAKRRARETLAGMIERDWNHPSIVIWTVINEGWGVDLAVNAEHRAWLAETYAMVKELDPHRLVVGNSPCFTNFHVVTDIEDFHNYYAMPDHYRQWRDWVQTFASRPPWTFAHVYESIDAWRDYVRDPWNPLPRTPAPEVRRRGTEPMVVSEFGNWGLPDLDKLKACYGGEEPWWFETGIEWGEGVVYPHGIEQRYRAYHLDRVFPTLGELAAASQRMQFTALKYEIEQMRRYPSIVGYVITEFTDVHWECNGLLDMCRNPKAYFDALAQINGADAIVPVDWERIAYWEGERCEVRLALSHFSSLDLRDARLEWRLDLDPSIGGTIGGLAPQRARLTNLGTVVFEVPRLEASARARLELALLTARGEAVARNHHELYFFPRTAARPGSARVAAPGLPRLAGRLAAMGYRVVDDPGTADVIVVETMTDEVRWLLQQGARVLWLAESSDSMQTYLGTIGIAQRRGRSWQGDWASSMSWIRHDRIFRGIPTGGTVDFAFADLTPEAVIVGLTPRDFAANVHAGLFVGWVHHIVALIAERTVGQGRLLISTFRLREHLGAHPVATVMMRDMIERLAGAVAVPSRGRREEPPPVPQPAG
ncbi:MAG TPA: glycoside hydrolase family 2 TIM barrel-domain containing protein [Gemmatimonadales bacterium]|nr:glycoside hydrolase family 2 TIM barrel-domain containing protein [Gemmatimonadales bacterium]